MIVPDSPAGGDVECGGEMLTVDGHWQELPER